MSTVSVKNCISFLAVMSSELEEKVLTFLSQPAWFSQLLVNFIRLCSYTCNIVAYFYADFDAMIVKLKKHIER